MLEKNQGNDGKVYAVCPICRRNHRLQQIRPDTTGRNIVAYCRVCKTEMKLDIEKGECYLSQGQ